MKDFASLSPTGQKLAIAAGWTEEREKELRRLFDLGLSAGRIAAALGLEDGRNKVIGKINRLGLTRSFHASGHYRPKGSGAARPAVRAPRTPSLALPPGARVNGSGKHASDCRPAQGSHIRRRRSEDVGTAAAVERSAAALKPAPDIFEPISRSCTIAELTAEHCRWPLGDPGDLDTFRYCGAQRTGEKRATAVSVPGGDSPYCAGHHRLAYNGARG